MKTNYRIDKNKNRTYTTVTGEISAEELIEHIERVNNDQEYRRGMDTLADFSTAKASHTIDLEKILKTKKYTEAIEEVRGQCKWAIYTQEENMYAFIQMFAMLTKGMQISV